MSEENKDPKYFVGPYNKLHWTGIIMREKLGLKKLEKVILEAR